MKTGDSEIGPFELHSATLRGLGANLRDLKSPITNYVVLAICLVFLLQEISAALLGVPIRVFTNYFFFKYPGPAWLLTFFLHKGIGHFFVNVALIGFVGRVVEPQFSKRAYFSFLIGSAVLSAIGAFLFKDPFTTKMVAAYGASGFGYALAGYSLYFPYRDGMGVLDALKPKNLLSNTMPAERIAFLLGVSAVLWVILDILSGPYLTAEWVNGAHLAGVVIGLLVGESGRSSLSPPNTPPQSRTN